MVQSVFDRAHNPSGDAITIEGASLLYGEFAALRDVSLRLPWGASVLLVGENGAGKSTLLRVIAGLALPTYGNVTVLGGRPRQERHRIAILGHAAMLYDELTGVENLAYFARLAGLQEPETAAMKALGEVGLSREAGKTGRRVGEYSQGMRQRASLARTLLSQPELLLLDEPFSNLDLTSSQAMIARLQSYLTELPGQRTLILTTHQVELAAPLAEITVRLAAGRVAAVEPAARYV